MIEAFTPTIPSTLFARSGKVFYAGRDAFSAPSPLYVLGINPGGNPAEAQEETIANHTSWVLERFPANWSAYRDEPWLGLPPGTYGMAPRVLHLFKRMGLDPGCVPASNLVFVRSRREQDMKQEMRFL